MDIRIRDVEAALLDHPSVVDCAVLSRKNETSNPQLVAYVVSAGPLLAEQLETHLRARLPTHQLPRAYVPLSNLPLTETGQVDKQALVDLEVIDSDLVQRWEERLQSLPEIKRVAVVVREQVESLPALHLSDLLPDWKAAATTTVEAPVAALVRPAAAHEESGPRAPALSHGGPLREEDDAPAVLSETLRRAALQAPNKGIIYIQSDGSEIIQSYGALLEEAERILGGLRKVGLKPQDKVIFQFDRNQDFISAFWGCVLGGVVPVPISIAPSYKDVNSTLSKLHNAWQMLDRPLVLTGKTLAPTLRSLSDLLNIDNFHVETIDELLASEPDQNWHDSDPDNLAILLLTSGSTGVPKAVMQSHRSLLSRSAGTTQLNKFSNEDVSLNWMPPHHVGGIIMFHVRDVYLGCQQIHAPTELILQDPLQWLDIVERFRCTVTWAPNFAFGLINAQEKAIRERHWDLSSMRFVLNGGEAIVARTARRFLHLLQPHGLTETCMHPAWGMSETSSGVTYSDSFSLVSTTDDDPFVEVGAPIPGFSMRIVDAQDQVLEEGSIGRLQVKGPSVTSGYYQNSELNKQLFTDDGWFKTGDLGFLHNGRLTITGREKDIIIINGINYYSHEIEAVVEEIEGVETSYTAACAIRDEGIDTDKLAIFFHTSFNDDIRLLGLLNAIRENVVKKAGVNPHYLIPVQKKDIPKTAIGKIQRSQLGQNFKAGEFDAILKRIDILSANSNTLPDWFYRKVWHRKEAVVLAPQYPHGQHLVLLDRLGLGAFLCTKLRQLGTPCVAVEVESSFLKLSTDRYRIDPKNPDHYRRLLGSLSEDNIRIDQVLHLWTYDAYAGEISGLEALEKSQDWGVYSLLFLIQALVQVQRNDFPVRLLVISSYTQPILPDDEIAYEKSSILGLIKTIPQEMPWLNCRHVDLPVAGVKENAAHILRELQSKRDCEVAYRNEQRLIPGLEKIDLRQKKQERPLKRGGMYLLSGGLGGISIEIAKYLLKNYQARLLLVGRTVLPERTRWDVQTKEPDSLAERIKAFQSLEQVGGEVIYQAVDICDLAGLQKVVERAQSYWRCELDGVFHLAGIFREHLLVEETRESFAATLRPKVSGTWTLHQLLKDRPNSLFVSFSSVNGFFGGFTAGAYAAANSFLDSFSHYQKIKSSLRSYCFAWSLWNEVGMSRGYEMKGLSRTRGYCVISAEQGLYSLLAGLHSDQSQLFTGLDGSNPYIRRYVATEPHHTQKLCAYFTAQANQLIVAKARGLEVLDRFGTPSTCDFLQVQEMPLMPNGKIDRTALPAPEQSRPDLKETFVAPRTPTEKTLAEIWAQVFKVDKVGVHDNFFELGGDSILSIQIVARANEAGLLLTPKDIFLHETIANLTAVAGAAPKTTEEHRDATGIINRLTSQASCDRPLNFPLARRDQRQLDKVVDRLARLKGESRKSIALEIEDIYPLSPVQWAMLFYSLCYPAASGVYHHQFCYSLRGDLDVALFERSWRRMVERHSILRTAFFKEPLQVVKRHARLSLHHRDWRGLSQVEQQKRLEEFLHADRLRRFEISEPPLMRLALFRISEGQYRFVWSIHHVLLDGWSQSILLEEVLACCEALSRGEEPDLKPAPPFRDYIAWLQAHEKKSSKAEAFWRTLLKDFTKPAPLGSEAAVTRSREQEEAYGRLEIQLSRDETARLRAFARQHRLTLNTLVQGGWALLLSRHSGEPDMLFGSVFSVRPSVIPGVESMVGPLINVLPMRVRLAPGDSVLTVLKKLRQQHVEMSQYDYSSLAKVQEWSSVPRGTALFDSLFLFQNFPEAPIRRQGGTFEIFHDRSFGRTNCALAMMVRPGPELSLGIGFDVARFDNTAVTRMLGDFQSLLRGIVGNPNQRVLDLLLATEVEAGVCSWSGTASRRW